jgi:malate dehydrogenase (oxaloacetate-decarboxylating)
MAVPRASHSIIMRIHLERAPRALDQVTAALTEVGGAVVGVDVIEARSALQIVDVTCNAIDEAHVELLIKSAEMVEGVRIDKVSDRTFMLHMGGKLEVASTVPLETRDDLSMAYTPGVARVCLAIADEPSDARRLTVKRNTVAVVSDGSAVLGLGNIGAAAAMPVMEGKAALFKRFAGVDAWPICLDTQDPDELVRTVQLLAPSFGGVNLEDISAPRCFEVEERLTELLDIPVFHDDQHGTAIVTLAALTNALQLVGKRLEDVRVAVAGAGAAGVAIVKMLRCQGIGELIVTDRDGILHPGRTDLDDSKRWLVEHTNPERTTGSLREAMRGADVFIGVSARGIVEAADVVSMAPNAIVFALANPDPEIEPAVARRHAAVVATGRSDEPNQINNVLAFPGVFRGALDAEARQITEPMKLAAARAIAAVVGDADLTPDHVIPSVFDPEVAPAVARAVAAAAPGA